MRQLLPAVLVLTALAGCNDPPGEPTVVLTPDAPGTLDDLLLVIEADAVDPNKNDQVSYRTAWRQDDVARDELNGEMTVRFGQTSKGETWSVSIWATDDKELGNPVELSVEIQNTAPTVTVEITPSAPRTDDSLRTTITKRDVDLDTVDVRYEWSVNGSVTNVVTPDLPNVRTNKGEVWEIAVIPSDEEGEGEPGTASVLIENTPPDLEHAEIRPRAPNKSDTLTCVGSGFYDIDDDPEGYQVEWLVNDSVASSELELDGATLTRGDEVQCRLTAWDGEDAGETVTSDRVIVVNSPPTVASVTIAPEDPLKDDVVVATPGETFDADGDEVTFTYSWIVNGRVAATTAELPPSRFRKDDVIQLSLTPFDGVDAGESVNSNIVYGGNNLPSLDLLELSPSPLYTDTVLEAVTITSDPDGDDVNVNYEWYVNGSLVSETSNELDGASWFERGDTVYAIGEADDGEDTGNTLTTDTATVVNSPPTQPEVSISPAEPEADDDLLCSLDTASTDADGDTITYRVTWARNGSAWGGSTSTTSLTGDTISADDTVDGDRWACTVTPSDGIETGTPGTASERLGGSEVLIIYDVKGSGTPSLEKALGDEGHSVTLSTTAETGYDGTNPSPSGYDVIIHLNGNGCCYSRDMPSGGQTAIESFVDGGGGFVHAEWNAYEIGLGRLKTLSKLQLLSRSSGVTVTGATYTKVGTHPVTANVGSSFKTSYSCGLNVGKKRSGTVVMTEGSNDAVVVDSYGKGRIVGFHHAGNYTADCLKDTNLLQLYVDAVAWAGGG